MANDEGDEGKMRMLFWWSCELIHLFCRTILYNNFIAHRAIKPYYTYPFGLHSKRDLKKKKGKGHICTKISVAALFVVARIWKMRGFLSIGE